MFRLGCRGWIENASAHFIFGGNLYGIYTALFVATKQFFKRVCLFVRPLAGTYITLLLFGVLVLGATFGLVSFSQHFKIIDFFTLISNYPCA